MASVGSSELILEASAVIRNSLSAVQNPNHALIDQPFDNIFHFDTLVGPVQQGLQMLRFFSSNQQSRHAPLAPNTDAYTESVRALQFELTREFEKVLVGQGANSAEALVAASVHRVRQALLIRMSATYGHSGQIPFNHGHTEARTLHAQGAHMPRASVVLQDRMHRSHRHASSRQPIEENQLRRESTPLGTKVMPRPTGFTVRQQDIHLVPKAHLRSSSTLAHNALARLRAFDDVS